MVIGMPMLVACLGVQPCQPGTSPTNHLIRSTSPAAIVTPTHAREAATTDRSRPLQLALRRVSIPSASMRSSARRSQVTRHMGHHPNTTKVMLVLIGAVAGCYAGAHLGAAVDDSPDDELAFVGMPVGAAMGGLIAWMLVR